MLFSLKQEASASIGGGTFTVSQEAEYDAMIEELERKIEENYLEWSEKGDAMRGE